MVFGREEKERFVKLMRAYERFCGVQVLAFCVMSNHFHVLVEVPLPPEDSLTNEELLDRLSAIYSAGEVEHVRELLRQRESVGDRTGLAELRERFLYRMWNLSEFMKSLKQRFSQWFNAKHDRSGTLWENTFRSVVVEDGHALRIMAAYIDLNPVRAGIVKAPEDYRWSSYAEALAGRKAARAGISRTMAKRADFFEEQSERPRAARPSWRKVIADYRALLFQDGLEVRDGATGQVKRRGVSEAAARRAQEESGQLSESALLHQRMRHFTEGMAIGSRSFLEEIFEQARDVFGPQRQSGARRIRNIETELCALRDLS